MAQPIISEEYISTGGAQLFFQPIVNGEVVDPNIELEFGNTDGIEVSVKVDKVEHMNTERSTQVPDLDIVKQFNAEVKVQTAEISPRMLAKAYAGNEHTHAQAAVTAQVIDIASATLEAHHKLGYYGITSISVTNADGSVSYAEGTDYTVDKGAGMLKPLAGGAIGDGDALKVTIDAPQMDLERVAALMGEPFVGRLIARTEPASGKRYEFILKKVQLIASGSLDLKGDKVIELEMDGKLLYDSTVTDPTLSKLIDIHRIPVR